MGNSPRCASTATPDQPFRGRVDLIAPGVNPKSRAARVRCVVSNPGNLLLPGMFAAVNLQTAGSSSALLVPKDAVLDDADKKVLFITCNECPEDKPGTAGCGAYDKLEVHVGALHGNSIEIKSGLEAGSYVVVAGQYQLKTAMGSGQLEAGCTGH